MLARCCCCLLAVAACAASQADDLIREVAASIPPEELEEPGNPVFAESLAELVAAIGDLGLSPAERQDLRLGLAEAWIGADRGEEALAAVEGAFAAGDLPGELHHRAGLALVAAWDLLAGDPTAAEELDDPVATLAERGDFAPTVRARAWAVQAQRLAAEDKHEDAVAAIEKALALLADSDPRERVPIYGLAISLKERAGMGVDAIKEWLLARDDDPAVAEHLDTLMTASQKLVGREAPPMKAARLDGEDGEVAVTDFAGEHLLLYFFASWSRASELQTPAVVRLAKGDDLEVLAVSLDNQDTVDKLGAFITRHGIDFPVIGEGFGWDSEMDDAYHVDAIPHLVLIHPDGKVAATGLIGEDVDATVKAVREALRSVGRKDAGDGAGDGPDEEALIP